MIANEATLENGTVVGGNELDRALWQATGPTGAGADGWRRVAEAPFDHERQLGSVLADGPTGRLLVAKGAPEAILARCLGIPAGAEAVLDRLFATGSRVVAVATRAAAAGAYARAGDPRRDRLTESHRSRFSGAGHTPSPGPGGARYSESAKAVGRRSGGVSSAAPAAPMSGHTW